MADQLSQEQHDKAVRWLKDKAPEMKCPACGHPHFGIVPHLVTPSIYRETAVIVGGPTYPQFLVVCNNCTYMMPFSAIGAGLVAPKEKPDG